MILKFCFLFVWLHQPKVTVTENTIKYNPYLHRCLVESKLGLCFNAVSQHNNGWEHFSFAAGFTQQDFLSQNPLMLPAMPLSQPCWQRTCSPSCRPHHSAAVISTVAWSGPIPNMLRSKMPLTHCQLSFPDAKLSKECKLVWHSWDSAQRY